MMQMPARGAALESLLQELETLPDSEVWRARIHAGLLRIAHERRLRAAGLVEFLLEESGPAELVFAQLDAKALTALGGTRRCWRELPHWGEHWFLLGVQDFRQHRRLVPPGRFERFGEVLLDETVDWPRRYRNFVQAAHCPDIHSLRLAAVRAVQAMDLETDGVEEVRRRLSLELHLDENFLSVSCVEQLLEDASTMHSVVGGLAHAMDEY